MIVKLLISHILRYLHVFRCVLTQFHVPAGHGVPVIRDVEKLSEIVGSTDQRQLDEEMIEQKHLETFPLFLPRLWLVLCTQTHTHTRYIRRSIGILKIKTFRLKPTTDLLDLVFLHEGQELEKESRQAEQEVNELMNEERPPCGNLKLGVIV